MQSTSYSRPAPQSQTVMYSNQHQNLPGNQIVMMPAPAVVVPNSRNYETTMFRSKFKSLGIAQLSIGISCLICGIVVAVFLAGSDGSGIWGGIWFIIAGTIGIISGSNPYKRYIITGFVLAVISIIMSVVIVILDSIAASDYGKLVSLYLGNGNFRYTIDLGNFDFNYAIAALPYILLAVNVTLACLAFANMIVAIRYCVYCYKSGFGQAFEEKPNAVGTFPVAAVSSPDQQFPQTSM